MNSVSVHFVPVRLLDSVAASSDKTEHDAAVPGGGRTRLRWATLTTHLYWGVAFLSLLPLALCAQVAHWNAPETELRVDRQTGRVELWLHRKNKASWVNTPFNLFRVTGAEGLRTELTAQSTADGLLLTLRITNSETNARLVTPRFPEIKLSGTNAADHRLLRYCFPVRSALVGCENRSDRAYYSGIGPLQFLAVDHPVHGSLHAVVCDTNNTRKLFGLDKTDETLRLFVEHEAKLVPPGGEWVLPPVLLSMSGGTWHSGLTAYRRWLASWYRSAAPRRSAFREVFNFRVLYPHHAPPLGSGIFDKATKRWSLREAVERDTRDWGGVDFVHLFDWASTPQHGRAGDYAPWDYLGGLAEFRNQIKTLRDSGIPSGLYLEGYLVSPESRIARQSGKDWAMTNAKGERVDAWGGGYFTMCPHVPGWQDYLAETCRRLTEETGADGLYIDQFGFLTQYRCHNPAHSAFHVTGAHMLAGEHATLRKIRAAVGPRAVLYTEEIPTDVMTQFTDGAYTASVNASLKRGVACPINLTRFALPDFKTIELISEEGLKDNLPAVRATFFNGEGLYLSGDVTLFSPACLAEIRRTHALLREHVEAFTSLDPTPLVPTLNTAVHANRFPARRSVVWTLWHTGATPYEGPALRVSHRTGARYYDAWNGRALTPDLTADGSAVLSVPLAAGGAGCVVQTW